MTAKLGAAVAPRWLPADVAPFEVGAFAEAGC